MNRRTKLLLASLAMLFWPVASEAQHATRWIDSSLSPGCTLEKFEKPSALAVDSKGTLFIGEAAGRVAIEMLTTTGERKAVLSSSAFDRGARGISVALDAQDDLLVSTSGDDRVFKLARSGDGFVGDLSPVATARIAEKGKRAGIVAIAADPNGDIVLVQGRLVIRADRHGAVHLVAGSNSKSVSTDGRGAKASFASPQGLLVLSDGRLLVADGGDLDAEGRSYAFGVVRAIDKSGNVSTFAGAYEYGDTGDVDGPKSEARMPYLRALSRLRDGSIVLIEDQVAMVRVIDPDGLVSTLFGRDRTELKRAELTSLAVDAADNIYFSDAASGTVYKATTAGTLFRLCMKR